MKNEIYDLGIKLGLNKKDIKEILKNTQMQNENLSLSLGGPGYPGAFYGTISIRDFKKRD